MMTHHRFITSSDHCYKKNSTTQRWKTTCCYSIIFISFFFNPAYFMASCDYTECKIAECRCDINTESPSMKRFFTTNRLSGIECTAQWLPWRCVWMFSWFLQPDVYLFVCLFQVDVKLIHQCYVIHVGCVVCCNSTCLTNTQQTPLCFQGLPPVQNCVTFRVRVISEDVIFFCAHCKSDVKREDMWHHIVWFNIQCTRGDMVTCCLHCTSTKNGL